MGLSVCGCGKKGVGWDSGREKKEIGETQGDCTESAKSCSYYDFNLAYMVYIRLEVLGKCWDVRFEKFLCSWYGLHHAQEIVDLKICSCSPICSPICSDIMPTLKNGFGLPTLAKGSVPRFGSFWARLETLSD